MLTTLLTASSLLFGQLIPEAPVAPAAAPPEEQVAPTPETPPIPTSPGGITAPATAAALAPAPQEVEPIPPPAGEQPPIPPSEPPPPPLPPTDPVLPPPPEPIVPALPAPRPVVKERIGPPIDFRVLGTLTLPMWATANNQPNFLVGLRSEFDISYFSMLFRWDRQGLSPVSLSETFIETSYWNGLVGGSVWATKGNRIRFLGGVSAINDYYGAKVGPTIGSTVRLGLPIIGVEGGVLYTPIGFTQFDGRIEAVLTLFIFELRAGYRGRWIEVRNVSDPPVVPSGGFTISAGLVF